MLPENLISVATSLKKQFELRKKPNRKIPLEEWQSLPSKTRDLIPAWVQELLATYSLAGPLFERKHETHDYSRCFRFWEPVTYGERITSEDELLFKRVITSGYIPLSDESDLDMWVTPIAGDATSPVFLYDSSGREIREMSKNLADFLASCKISDLD